MWRYAALSAFMLIAATSAQAQVTQVTGSEGSTVTFPRGGVKPNGQNVVHGSGILTNVRGSGSSYDTSVVVTPSTVSFEAGNAVSGPFVSTRSTTAVDLVFTNPTDGVLATTLHSSITPAGMGFYLADTSSGCGGNVYTGCPQSLSNLTFSDLRVTGENGGGSLAFAGFDFSVSQGGSILYQVKGSLNLVYDPKLGAIVQTSVANAASVLSGFTQVTPLGSQSAMGFAWDDTDFVVPLGSLGVGQSTKLTYSTTVETYSHTGCINSTTCLVAYSGFGDPIGRGGGTSFAAINMLSPFSGPTGVTFSPSSFNLPTYNKGVLTFLPGGSTVPEPAAWALMLLGFASVGLAARRGRPRPLHG